MDLTKFTSFDTVRALLGLTADELTDADLSLPVFYINLTETLLEISSELLPTYESLIAVPSSSLTAAQKRFVDVAQVFAATAVAVQMLDTLPMLALRTEEDARAKYEKFADPFSRVDPSVRATYAKALARLQAAFNILANTPVVVYNFSRVLTTSAGLASDPVTGA